PLNRKRLPLRRTGSPASAIRLGERSESPQPRHSRSNLRRQQLRRDQQRNPGERSRREAAQWPTQRAYHFLARVGMERHGRHKSAVLPPPKRDRDAISKTRPTVQS